MYKVLPRKPDPSTMTASVECKHLHYFPLCDEKSKNEKQTNKKENPETFYLPLSVTQGLPALVIHCLV